VFRSHQLHFWMRELAHIQLRIRENAKSENFRASGDRRRVMLDTFVQLPRDHRCPRFVSDSGKGQMAKPGR